METSERLRQCRVSSGLTQRELAELAGTSQPTVAAYEAGRVTPSVETLERLLDACGYRIEIVVADEPRWTRTEEKSLAIHRLIAARLLTDTAATLRKARANLDRLYETDTGHARQWLDLWNELLSQPVDVIATAMLARSQTGIDLRQMTPFAGVLTDAERRRAIRSVPRSDAAA